MDRSLEEVCRRLDLLQERLERTRDGLERRMWLDCYENNLRDLYPKAIESFSGISRYVGYQLYLDRVRE